MLTSEWSIRKLGAIAEKMAERLYPGARQQQKSPDRYESHTKERREGDRVHKTTFISFADMYKRANAGQNTTIKTTGRV